MTRRLPVTLSPSPLEDYALRFDDLLRARAQREGFRRYLEGLLLPDERNKTLTALANREPMPERSVRKHRACNGSSLSPAGINRSSTGAASNSCWKTRRPRLTGRVCWS